MMFYKNIYFWVLGLFFLGMKYFFFVLVCIYFRIVLKYFCYVKKELDLFEMFNIFLFEILLIDFYNM